MDDKKIFDFLEKGRLRQAFEFLLPLVRNLDEFLYIDLVILSARFSATERAFDLKLISFDEWIQARSEIAKAIINIIQEASQPEVEDSG